MKRLWIGADGGGSKTLFRCFDEHGNLLGETRTGSTYAPEHGLETVLDRLEEGIHPFLENAEREHVILCLGLPGFTESPEDDRALMRAVRARFDGMTTGFYNDVACAWAGALALRPGISIVGGTGSMSYGRDESGAAARSGGWNEYFSDEGSGMWLGKKLLELFAKQCDGRLAKGPLHEIVREQFGLEDDYDILENVRTDFRLSRHNTARLQPLLLKAARAGDASAQEAYSQAVRELAQIVLGTYRQLDSWTEPVRVSCIGGLFRIHDLILEPMTRLVEEQMPAKVRAPLLGPCEGAVLFGAADNTPDELDTLRSALLARTSE